MKKKKRIKHIIIILAIVALVVTFGIIRRNRLKYEEENRPLNSIYDLKNARDVMRFCGGEYLGEKESTDENYKTDIYVKFKTDLYTDDTSNEEYFRTVVRTMSYVLKFDSFRIADDDKKILIAVVCNKDDQKIETTYINGYVNYFAKQNSEIDYNKMQKASITEFNVQSLELKTLINGNWNKNKIYFSTGEKIEVKNIYKKVFNIVFKSDYKGNILNNISVNTSFDDIISILGEPTFDKRYEYGFIGYKGNNIYVFFNNGSISIYPIENTDTKSFIDLIKQFDENGDVKKFVSSVTSLWPDYDKYDYGEQFVDLIYTLKGVKIQFNITDKHGVVAYNNYIGSLEELKQIQEETGIQEIYFVNEDSVCQKEIERVSDVRG